MTACGLSLRMHNHAYLVSYHRSSRLGFPTQNANFEVLSLFNHGSGSRRLEPRALVLWPTFSGTCWYKMGGALGTRRLETRSMRPELDMGGDGGDSSGGDVGNGKFYARGGGGGGDHEEDDEEGKEFGPVLNYEEVIREIETCGARLPKDMLDSAKITGIRKAILERYLNFQGSVWPLGEAIRSCKWLRNRMLADDQFLFKVATEVVIDTCCATFAEIQKRGKDFWAEFELYAADISVGIVVDIALVGLLAPYIRFGQPSASKGFFGSIKTACEALPSSVFEAAGPRCSFSLQQRAFSYLYKGILYASVGFICGLIGQGLANLIMSAKRIRKKSEVDIPVPPLIKSAALWGVFLGVSSNTRYQIINGLEYIVESSPLAKHYRHISQGFTVAVRFSNNIYGGMQFIDWAWWSGVQ